MNRSRFSNRAGLFSPAKISGIILACLFIGLCGSALAGSGNPDFPRYPVIENNVRFWKDIYTKYTLNTAVIHDKTISRSSMRQ